MKKSSFKDNVIFVFVLSIFVKAMGLLRELIFSWAWGVSATSDAYVIASTIPNYLTILITTGVTTCFLPIYISLKQKKNVNLANEYSSKIINVIFCVSVIIVGLSFIFTKQIITIFASGFSGEMLDMAINLTRITIFETFSISLIAVLTAILQSEKKYYIVLISGIFLQLFYCIGAFISKNLGIEILAYAGVIGYIIQIIMLLIFSYKVGYKYSLNFNIFDENVKHTLQLLIPVIISSSASEISKIVDKTLASRAELGGVTMLNYANKIDDTLITIFTTSIITIAYPIIVKAISCIKEKNEELKASEIIVEYLSVLMMLVIPLSLGGIIFSKELIRFVFYRGAFLEEYIKPTAFAFSAYAIGIPFFTLRKYISRVFYAFHETKIPTINSIISIAINIVISIALSYKLGIVGVALGTSISAIIASISLLLIINSKKIKIDLKTLNINVIKILIITVISILCSKLLFIICNKYISNNINFVLSIILAMVIYIFLLIKIGFKKYLLLLKK